MNDRCPQCNSIHFYTKRNVNTQWDSSSYTIGDKPSRPIAKVDDRSEMNIECLDCKFSCLYSEFPKVKERIEKQKKVEEIARERSYTDSKIKMLYEAGNIEEAEKFYLKNNKFTDRLPNIDAVYRNFGKSETPFRVIFILFFVLISALIIWLLDPYPLIVSLIGVFVALFFVLKFIVKRIMS